VGTQGLVVFGSYDKNIYGLNVMTGERVFTIGTQASPGLPGLRKREDIGKGLKNEPQVTNT
jgi:outer membrane protein assembly factor BamB